MDSLVFLVIQFFASFYGGLDLEIPKPVKGRFTSPLARWELLIPQDEASSVDKRNLETGQRISIAVSARGGCSPGITDTGTAVWAEYSVNGALVTVWQSRGEEESEIAWQAWRAPTDGVSGIGKKGFRHHAIPTVSVFIVAPNLGDYWFSTQRYVMGGTDSTLWRVRGGQATAEEQASVGVREGAPRWIGFLEDSSLLVGEWVDPSFGRGRRFGVAAIDALHGTQWQILMLPADLGLKLGNYQFVLSDQLQLTSLDGQVICAFEAAVDPGGVTKLRAVSPGDQKR